LAEEVWDGFCYAFPAENYVYYLSLLTGTSVELLIPYRRVLNVELVKEWAGW
jgi:hypothetical protein